MSGSPSSWCRHLRWKEYERDRANLERVAWTFDNDHELYICVKTAQAVGWDDGLVGPGACGEGRACYDEHPLLQITRQTLS